MVGGRGVSVCVCVCMYLIFHCGLNVYAPSKSYVKTLILNGMVLGGRAFRR